MGTLFLILLGVMGVVFLFFPLVVLLRQKIAVHPRFVPLDLTRLPSLQLTALQRTVETLQKDGFVPEAYLKPVESSPKSVVYFVVLANRAVRNSAIITLHAPQSTVQKPAVAGSIDVTFQTRYSGGTVIETHNSSQLDFTPPMPSEVRNFLPSIKDLHRLYQVHTYTLENLFGNNLREGKALYEEAEAAEYLPRMVESCLEAQLENGYIRLDTSRLEHTYRPTLKGAYLVTWSNLFPVTVVRWFVRTIREREILSDFQRSSWGVALR